MGSQTSRPRRQRGSSSRSVPQEHIQYNSPSPNYSPFVPYHTTEYGVPFQYSTQDHGEASHHDPHFYPNLFHQEPENIALRGRASHEGGSSSSYSPGLSNLSLFEGSRQASVPQETPSPYLHGHLLDFNVSPFHRRPYQVVAAADDEQQSHMDNYEQRVSDHVYGQQHNRRRRSSARFSLTPSISSSTGERIRISPTWAAMNNAQKNELLEVVSKRRGLLSDTVRKNLRPIMTEEMRNDMLSEDQEKVDALLASLWPVTETNPLPIWMNGLDDRQREALVARVVRISGQKKNIVRNYFLRRGLTPEMAQELYSADDTHFLALADFHGFTSHENLVDSDGTRKLHAEKIPVQDWEYRLKSSRRSVVIEMVRGAFGKGLTWAHTMLRQPHIPRGFGKALLEAKPKKRALLLKYMFDGTPLPEDDPDEEEEEEHQAGGAGNVSQGSEGGSE
ncbi:hypothetical protein CBS101457_000267 [Exobasidium rhododendri]|nr:hypothetical protein CBS101457_000267 [Exobasidium rhododendri]